MNERVLVKQVLLSSNFWVLNKTVVKIFGLETAFLLVNLAEAENMMSDEQGWFYQTSDTLEELTGLSRYKQDKCIEELEGHGVLEKDVRGIPAKRYFRFNHKALSDKIVKNSQTTVKNISELELKEFTTNKESINKESNKEYCSTEVEPKVSDSGEDKKTKKEMEEDFEKLWKLYPNKAGKKKAKSSYMKAIKDGVTNKKIQDGIVRYKTYLKQEDWIKPAMGSTWFNQERWDDELDIKEIKYKEKKKVNDLDSIDLF